MNKPTKANFCSSVRKAIEQLGCSSVMALNVVNAELGNMKHVKSGEDKTEELKIKRKAIADGATSETVAVANTASVNVKPGTMKFETHKVTTALSFARFDDLIKKAEVECPTLNISFDKGSMFEQWLRKIATPKASPAEKEESLNNPVPG